MNICTSIEQSKKLLKLGLDPNTADMCYVRELWWDDKVKKMKEDWDTNPVVNTDGSEDVLQPVILPAWSLSKLLELMPSIVRLNEHGFTIQIGKLAYEEYWYVSYEWEGHVYQVFKGTLIDAAFKMVCWLKENNKI